MAILEAAATVHHRPWYRHLYVQVLCAIVIGWLLLATAEKAIETAASIRRLESESYL